MTYEVRCLDERTTQRLIELSEIWLKEDCCYGMAVNTAEDIKEPLVVALDNNEIV